ncbi:MAG: hypothetical protein PWP24_1977 [Clostridiales bacterium]|nr:hypothetical protein [Clostridiales bacterium]
MIKYQLYDLHVKVNSMQSKRKGEKSMKERKVLRRVVPIIMVFSMLLTMLPSVTANAASTTEKKGSVSFTKTKASGFTKIASLRSTSNYLIVLGEKKSGNVLSYSSDGNTFKDVDLDAAIEKEYKGETLSSITLNTYISYINKRNAYCVMGTAATKEEATYNFLVSVSSDMKKVSVEKLDDLIKTLDSQAEGIEFDRYFDYDYETGLLIVNGSYNEASGSKVPVYIVMKKGADAIAYKNPNTFCDRVEFVGKYLVCYNWQLNLTGEWEQATTGYFYYSKDYKTWTKAKTPEVNDANSWQRSYYEWETFGAAPQSSSDTYTLYYTSNMKDFKSISKKFVISGYGTMDFQQDDKKLYAIERGYDEKQEIAISLKSGDKWKVLFQYKAKSNDFNYQEDRYTADGMVLIKDGTTKKLFLYGKGKEYSTKLDVDKLNLYGDMNGVTFGTYDNNYLLASKNALATYYLFKTPVKVKGVTSWSKKNVAERFYVYSDSAIYYVTQATVTKAVK